jgi:hypothetical protein
MGDLIKGVYPKQKHDNAPNFVIGKFNINVPQLLEFLKEWQEKNPGKDWLNTEAKVSKNGKASCFEDDWQNDNASLNGSQDKQQMKAPEILPEDDIPF